MLTYTGYIFFDKAYCDTHKIVGGRNIANEDSRIIDAGGPGFTGGKWIQANSWWVRTYLYQSNTLY